LLFCLLYLLFNFIVIVVICNCESAEAELRDQGTYILGYLNPTQEHFRNTIRLFYSKCERTVSV